MTSKYNVLILTDHKNHSSENSLYDLSVKMLNHQNTKRVDIASRAIGLNKDFFNSPNSGNLYATSINAEFAYSKMDHPLNTNHKEIDTDDYDLIWLRIPPPIDEEFLNFLSFRFKNQVVINDPAGIYTTGSKQYLMNFQSVCPPMMLCNSIEDVIEFKKQFSIVLKPFREFGGKGILKIDGDIIWSGKTKMSFAEFVSENEGMEMAYLGVKYLKNVSKGDKRIIVVNGKILGSSLRLPAKNSWLCNIAMGGTSNRATIEKEEYEIVEKINAVLSKKGIVMYGVDTLVDDDGKRVLSEINTTSIGGLPQIARLNQEPIVEQAIDLIWEYFQKEKNEK